MKGLQLKQLELDKFIIKKHGLEGKNLFENKVIALDVELSEFMNNLETFKHWKINKGKPNALEEACDCLHFILSIANDIIHTLKLPVVRMTKSELSTDIKTNMQYVNIKKKLFMDVLGYEDGKALDIILNRLVKMLRYHGYTWEDLTKEYDRKYEINIQRQNEGY